MNPARDGARTGRGGGYIHHDVRITVAPPRASGKNEDEQNDREHHHRYKPVETIQGF